jgi:hypothetical protein
MPVVFRVWPLVSSAVARSTRTSSSARAFRVQRERHVARMAAVHVGVGRIVICTS